MIGHIIERFKYKVWYHWMYDALIATLRLTLSSTFNDIIFEINQRAVLTHNITEIILKFN